MNSIDSSTKTIICYICPTDSALEFSELMISINAILKQILPDVISVLTNSFPYMIPSPYFHRKNIEKVPGTFI